MNIKIDQATTQRINDRRERLADLADIYHERELARDAAVAAVRHIERAWATGDDAPTAAEHILATTEATRAEALLERAGTELVSATRRRALESTALAEVIAHKLAELLGGVTTVITDRVPADDCDKVTHATPRLYIVQTAEASDEGGGQLAADISLNLYGKSRIVSLPPAPDIEAVLREGGWIARVTRHDSVEVGDVWLSSATLRVERGWLPVPIIDPSRRPDSGKYQGNRIDTTGDQILWDVLTEEITSVASMNGASVQLTPGASRARLEVDEEGITREHLTVPFGMKIEARNGWAIDPEAIIRAATSTMVGKLIPLLGVIEAISGEVEVRGRDAHARAFTFVRREPSVNESDDAYGDEDYGD